VKEGAAADQAVQLASRKTTSRQELGRNPEFADISPEVGEIDEIAFDEAMAADPDATLSLLAEMTGALDAGLREAARRLAGSIMVDVARRGVTRRRGVGRIVSQRFRGEGDDVDLDGSIDAIVAARALGEPVDAEGLRILTWVKPATAYCLLVDRSGSMTGKPLATSAIAAAAMSLRSSDYSVVAFAADAVVVKSQSAEKSVDRVVSDILCLRGFGTTDVGLALREAQRQLAPTRAGRRITVLLSDCRSTSGDGAVASAAGLDELVILAPEGDSAEAEAFARAVGARLALVAGPTQIPEALACVLSE
jgi:VWA domain containing CoxE-like protein